MFPYAPHSGFKLTRFVPNYQLYLNPIKSMSSSSCVQNFFVCLYKVCLFFTKRHPVQCLSLFCLFITKDPAVQKFASFWMNMKNMKMMKNIKIKMMKMIKMKKMKMMKKMWVDEEGDGWGQRAQTQWGPSKKRFLHIFSLFFTDY